MTTPDPATAPWVPLGQVLQIKTGMIDIIQEITLAAAYGNMDFVSIPQGYKHLGIILQARSDAAVLTTNLNIRLNNDAGSNYDTESMAIRTTVANNVSSAQAAFGVQEMPGASGTALAAAVFDILFPFYAQGSLRKQMTYRGWGKSTVDGTTTGYETLIGGGEWRSAAAINRITMAPATGNFAAGTQAILYGIGGATLVPGPNGPIYYGTTLPSTPVDGQEAILVDSLTAPTYQWHFKYVAGISDAYKWIFLGGAELNAETTTSETTTGTSYGNLSGGATGPAITIPRAGIYDVRTDMTLNGSTAGVQGNMSYDIGATGAVDADAMIGGLQGSSNVPHSHSRTRRKTFTSAGTTLTSKYKVTTGTGTFTNRTISARPVRVA